MLFMRTNITSVMLFYEYIMNNMQVIEFDFSKKRVNDLTEVFKDTPTNFLNSKINMTRCIDKMEGNNNLGFTYFKQLVSRSECGERDESILAQFYSQNNSSLDALSLITPASENYFYLEIQKRYSNIQPLPPKVNLESIDLSYRQVCADRFDLFTSADLTPLKNILLSMEQFPEHTYVLIYPYLGSLLELSVFTACFSYFSDNFFFESLFRHCVDRIEVSACSSNADTVPYTHSRIFFVGAIISSSLMSGLFAYYYGISTKLKIPDISHEDPLAPYRFTGQLGEAITCFEENSGAVLYTACNLCVTYAEIFVLTFIEPYEGLGIDLKILYSQMY